MGPQCIDFSVTYISNPVIGDPYIKGIYYQILYESLIWNQRNGREHICDFK